jgi:nucleoside-diphosphate-sugar epimerase
MVDLANEIISLTKSKSKIVYLPLPEDDPISRIPDISQAKKTLDWEPHISRAVGLEKTVRYFKSTLKL